MDCVLYHKNCLDGLGSAAAAYTVLGDQALYIPVHYGEALPTQLYQQPIDTIYIVDFSYPLSKLYELEQLAKHVQIIDHHQSAYEDFITDISYVYVNSCCQWMPESIQRMMIWLVMYLVSESPAVFSYVCGYVGIGVPIFDTSKSGAYLTWEYFNPGQLVPRVIRHTSDRDLWQFKYTDTKACMKGVETSGSKTDIKYWVSLITDEELLDGVISHGSILLKNDQAIVNNYTRDTSRYKIMEINGLKAVVYNANTLICEIAESFYTGALSVDFTISYFITGAGTAILSFRSYHNEEHTSALRSMLPSLLLNNKCDVNVIEQAKVWGGGGHRNASGATLSPADTIKFLIMVQESAAV